MHNTDVTYTDGNTRPVYRRGHKINIQTGTQDWYTEENTRSVDRGETRPVYSGIHMGTGVVCGEGGGGLKKVPLDCLGLLQ